MNQFTRIFRLYRKAVKNCHKCKIVFLERTRQYYFLEEKQMLLVDEFENIELILENK